MSASACEVLHSYLADPLLYDQTSLYVKGVYENNIETIPVVLETIQGILKDQSSENPHIRLNGLRLLKECMEVNNRAFIFNVESTLIGVLGDTLIHRKRRSFLDHKPTAQEEKVNLSFYVLTLECIKVWSHWFPHDSSTPNKNPQNDLHKKSSNFKNVYELLLHQGVKFPQKLHFFRDIDLYKYNLKRRGEFLLARMSQHLRDLEDLEDSGCISEIFSDIEYYLRHAEDFQDRDVSEHTSLELERLLPVAKQVFVPLRSFQKCQIDFFTLKNTLKDILKQAAEMIDSENYIALSRKLSFNSGSSDGSQIYIQNGENKRECSDFDFKCHNAVQSINAREKGAEVLSAFQQCDTQNRQVGTDHNMIYRDNNSSNNVISNTNNAVTLRSNRLGSSESSQSEKSSETTQISSSSSVFNQNPDNDNPQGLQFSSQDFKRGEIALNNSSQFISPLLNSDQNTDDFKLACLKQSHCLFENDCIKIITTSRLHKDIFEQLPESEEKSDKQKNITNPNALRRNSSNNYTCQLFQLQVLILSKIKSITSVETDYYQILNSQIITPAAVSIQSDSDNFEIPKQTESSNIKILSNQSTSDNETLSEFKLIKKDIISIQAQYLTNNSYLCIVLGLVYTNEIGQTVNINNIFLPISILNAISYQDLNTTDSLNECLKDWCEPESTKQILKTPLFAVNPQLFLNEHSILSYFPSLKKIPSASKHFREYFTIANILDSNQMQEISSNIIIKFTLISNKCMRVQIKEAALSEHQSKQEKFPTDIFLSTIQELFKK